MRPFENARRWAGEAPPLERCLTAVVAVLVLALVAWAVTPAGDRTGGTTVAAGLESSTSPGTPSAGAPTSAGTDAAGVEAGTSAPTGAAAEAETPSAGPTASPAGPTASAPAPTSPGATGCTGKEPPLKVGVILASLGDANGLIGLPSIKEWTRGYQALFDQYNRGGGVGCRKLVGRYFEDRLTGPDEHSICLQVKQEGINVVLNNLFTLEERNCIPQARIPNIWYTQPLASSVKAFAPYVISYLSDYDRLIRDYVFGSRQYGFFDGMAKIGLLEQTCYPEVVAGVRRNLAEIGVGNDRISAFNYGCPSALSRPDQHTAAVLQFRREGVTHVMSAYRESISGFTDAAEQQRFTPKYSVMDDSSITLYNYKNPPLSKNFDGALIITKSQFGAEFEPAPVWNKATVECAATLKSAGLRPPYQTGNLVGPAFGQACAQVKMLAIAGAKATAYDGAALARALGTIGKVELSFPVAASDFRDPTNPTGSQFWRATRYRDAGCTCVRLVDGRFHPEFA